MDSKANFFLSLNLFFYFISPTACDDTCSNSSGLTPPSGGGAYVKCCPYNSSSSSSPTLPGGGGVYVAPCPYNSSLSYPTLPGDGGAYVAPCSFNSSSLSLSCLTPSNASSVYVAPCPRDALKLGICVNLLGKLVGAEVGNPPITPCCTLLAGLADLEVAVCFCTAIKANILGIKLDVPITLSLLLNVCGIKPPSGFICG